MVPVTPISLQQAGAGQKWWTMLTCTTRQLRPAASGSVRTTRSGTRAPPPRPTVLIRATDIVRLLGMADIIRDTRLRYPPLVTTISAPSGQGQIIPGTTPVRPSGSGLHHQMRRTAIGKK